MSRGDLPLFPEVFRCGEMICMCPVQEHAVHPSPRGLGTHRPDVLGSDHDPVRAIGSAGGGGCPAGKVYGWPGCGVYLMHVSGLQHAEANAVAE